MYILNPMLYHRSLGVILGACMVIVYKKRENVPVKKNK